MLRTQLVQNKTLLSGQTRVFIGFKIRLIIISLAVIYTG